jgi:hypothetical protein
MGTYVRYVRTYTRTSTAVRYAPLLLRASRGEQAELASSTSTPLFDHF